MSLNFSYGIIAIVGILVAVSIGFIVTSPDEIPEPRVIVESQLISESTSMIDNSAQAEATAQALPTTLTVSLPVGSGVPGCEVTNECFLPYEKTVAIGATVTWNNDDTAAHTVTSGSPSDGPDGLFDSSIFMAGSTFEFTFNEAGSYDYFCMVHPWMIGFVDVV